MSRTQPESTWESSSPLDGRRPREIPGRLGRYVIVEELGEGGMGTVFEALDASIDRKVALKVLHGDLDERRSTRLRREAQALATLSHPHVVQVYEAGEVNGLGFVAMEFVDGTTVREWMTTAHDWRQCVEVFVQLGRGLAAAHARGLVHRDFKPSNAIIDDQGRARVLDFGLARRAPSADRNADDPAGLHAARTTVPEDEPDHSALGLALNRPALDTPLTRTGAMIGTPAYMSLEQIYGREADARSDQFSFCVSLWEAIYGVRPYAGDTVGTLVVALSREQRQTAATSSAVPRALRRALGRGMSPVPDERWPSMDALLAELQRLLEPRRRWPVVALGGGLLAAAGTLAVVPSLDSTPDSRCTGARAQLQGIWDEARRDEVGGSMLGTELSFAHSTWDRVRPRLDEYASTWIDAHTEACEATVVRAEQGDDVMDVRMACLRDARVRLRTTVDVLALADRRVVEEATGLVDELPPLSRCADVEQLVARRQRVPPPEDPELVREVAALRERLARAQAARTVGKSDDARAEFDSVVARAEELGYPPLRAEALLHRGLQHRHEGRYPESEQDLGAAHALALEQGYDELALESAEFLAFVVGYLQARSAEGLRWARTALSMAERTGDPAQEAESMKLLGIVLVRKGELDQAESWLARARDTLDEHPSPRDELVVDTLNNLAGVYYQQGRQREAEAVLRQVVEVSEVALGPDHPRLARYLSNLGLMLESLERLDEAEALYRRALGVIEAALGPDHPDVAQTMNNLGITLTARGKLDEAESVLREALERLERVVGPDHIKTATSVKGLGRLLVARGDHEAAEPLFRRALEIDETVLGPEHPNLITILGDLASTLEAREQLDQAQSFYERGLRIAEGALGAEHPDVAELRLGLARVALALDELDKGSTVNSAANAAPGQRIRPSSTDAPDMGPSAPP